MGGIAYSFTPAAGEFQSEPHSQRALAQPLAGVADVGAIVAYFTLNKTSLYDLIITLAITGFVAALTVSGKALGKTIAIRNNNSIVYFTAKILSVFGFDKKQKNKKEKI